VEKVEEGVCNQEFAPDRLEPLFFRALVVSVCRKKGGVSGGQIEGGAFRG